MVKDWYVNTSKCAYIGSKYYNLKHDLNHITESIQNGCEFIIFNEENEYIIVDSMDIKIPLCLLSSNIYPVKYLKR